MPTTLPDREALRALYDEAVLEIQNKRKDDDGQPCADLTNGFYAQTGNIVFERGYLALSDFCSNGPSRIHTIPSPVGSGKTTFSYALIATVTRHAKNNPNAPYGCVFVVDQIPKADKAYQELNALLPGEVAVWTGEHDPKCKTWEKLSGPPDAVFDRDELKRYPIIVVTHQFYNDRNGYKAKRVLRDGREHDRALTIIDERPDGEVDTYEITLDKAQRLKDALVERRPDLREPLDVLLGLLMPYTLGNDSNTIRRPTRDLGVEALAKKLEWFATAEAESVVVQNARDGLGDLGQLFGVAKSFAKGWAVAVPTKSTTYFVGWDRKGMEKPGMMLLDATSDIDGVSYIAPWRDVAEVPQARYDNLEIILVSQHTKRKLKEYLGFAKNQIAYVSHTLSVINEHMQPGEHGLVICKKTLFDHARIPTWPESDPRRDTPQLYTDKYRWDVDGRKLCAVHWGTGIGRNEWKDADVVFLFDEFYIPRRTSVAQVQALREETAEQGDLGSMTTISSKARGVDILNLGHRLRHMRQMALRGRARIYDQHGVCGKQRLVISCDLKSFLEHKDKLFPGAKITVVGGRLESATWPTKVLDALGKVDPHTTEIKTRLLERTMGKPWRSISSNVLTPQFDAALSGLGWKYEPGKGCKGSSFRRTSLDVTPIPQWGVGAPVVIDATPMGDTLSAAGL